MRGKMQGKETQARLRLLKGTPVPISLSDPRRQKEPFSSSSLSSPSFSFSYLAYFPYFEKIE
jgi:hypothetical protein